MDAERTHVCDYALTQVFSLLGKRWTGMIIGVLLEGPRRFAELARSMPSITDGMLSSRLAELREAGLVERQIIEGPPVATIYQLTPRGLALRPALTELAGWARQHMDSSAGTAAAQG
ncbi:helix-turn-helix domain-containing protein [soil metagenome]